MKYIIVEDNHPFAQALCILLSPTKENCNKEVVQIILPESFDNLEALTNAIIDGYIDKDDVFFVNVNLIINGCSRQEQKGVELLVWLRIKGIINHVVLYSFETLYSLLNRMPKHLVITSKGISFVQLPFTETYFEKKKFEELSKAKAEENNLKQTLKAIFNKDNKDNIDSFRHQDANWWGVKVMYDVYAIVENSSRTEYPDIVKKKLSNITNAVAKYIYENKDALKEVYLREKRGRENLIEGINNELNELTKRLQEKASDKCIGEQEKEKLESDLNELNMSLSDYYNAGLLQEREQLMEDIKFWETEISKVNDEMNPIKENISTLENSNTELNNEMQNLAKNLKKNYNYLLINYEIIKNKISERKLKILYIDDNAKDCWEDLLKKVLGSTVDIESVIPKKKYEYDIQGLYENQVKDKINSDTSLILLDLRLFNESERSIEVQSISGKKLLDIIRKHHKGIPILIITASNKVWSYEELMKSGADAYWIKEGIDNNFSAKESVRNYCKLLQLVESLTGEKYEFLKDFAESIHKFESSDWWWENKNWEQDQQGECFSANNQVVPPITQVNKTDLKQLFIDGVELFREFLATKTLAQGYSFRSRNDWFYYSSIILHIGKAIELIHNLCSEDYLKYGSFNEVFVARGDEEGQEIYKQRNAAAHLGRSQHLKFKDLKDLITKLNEYLFSNNN